MKVSLITTVYNEESSIEGFLESVLKQTLKPDELVIVDGKSKDRTVELINKFIVKHKDLNLKLIIKKGNRSIGRNEAIRSTKNEIIAITDAGNILDKNWLKNIIKPFDNKRIDVIAGYYKGLAKNIFQKCLIPFTLVMPDKVKTDDFLPATRSMAIKKSVWKKAGGFEENLSHNEDFAFANKLKKMDFSFAFAKDAIVNWVPRQNLKQSFIMFFRFALGDIEAGIFRNKVIYKFLLYIFGFYLLVLSLIMRSIYLWIFDAFLFFGYFYWSIVKNYKYINDYRAIIILPMLQVISDVAVLFGSSIGLIKRISVKKIWKTFSDNLGLFIILLFYVGSMFSVINWGIPNLNHPFTYHMDEWHFSQALRTFLKYGTGSYSGAASIPLFHILSTYIFLTPFFLLKVFNPFLIKASLDNLSMQTTFFELLRLHTLFYGVLSVIMIFKIINKFINFKSLVFTAIFAFTPIWIILSNYYKYDITLNFWILTTIFFIFKFNSSKKFNDYMFGGIACALALATKFTAAPLFLIYVISYFIFSNKIKLKEIVLSSLFVLFIFFTVGIPDMLLLKGNYYELLNSTLIRGPKETSSYILGDSTFIFLLFKEVPQMFGYFLTYFSYLAFIFWFLVLGHAVINKRISDYKIEIFTFLSIFIYLVPTLSFGIDGGNNRALVLLPFFIIITLLFFRKISWQFKSFKNLLTITVLIGLLLQVVQSFAWQSVKLNEDVRVSASKWLVKNLPHGSTIGIENIPIYQQLPDLVLKEFYLKERDKNIQTIFNYKIVSASDENLPKYIIVSNDYQNVSYMSKSPKKDLIIKLGKKGYKRLETFTPYLSLVNNFSNPFVFLLTFPAPRTLTIYVQ